MIGKASKLSAISYKLLHSFFCNGNISAPWVKFVKDILDNCGLSNVWTFQNINFNTEWVIAYVTLKTLISHSNLLMKIYILFWSIYNKNVHEKIMLN
jgi:hypothetical protein